MAEIIFLIAVPGKNDESNIIPYRRKKEKTYFIPIQQT